MTDAEVATTGTPPPAAPALSSRDDDRRLAFLLHLLSSAPGRRLTRGELNKKLRTKAAETAGLAPESVTLLLDCYLSRGYVQVEVARRRVAYTLTDAGAAQLDTIRGFLPEVKQPGGRGKVIPPSSDQVRDHRTIYLLLEVLKAPGQSLPASDTNAHLDRHAREGLELNAATARHLWHELVAQGLLAASGNGRLVRYALTPAGRIKLANAEFPSSRKVTLSGQALTALLEAAREVGKQFASPTAEQSEAPARAELDCAVLAAFHELLRERHSVTGLVPIHEVRDEIRKRFGAAPARHDLFDDVVLDLWRAKRIRLTPIADHAKVTPSQLQDAIPGVGETLFYLEAIHAPATV